MKKKRTALFHSVISLLLCVSMLIGTTFAWFTDSVTTGINTIAAGNLDVELYHSNAAVTNERVDSNTKLFMDLQGDPILWEPGVVSYENLRITNEGDLALAYQLAINTANENYIVDPSGALYGLSHVLKVGVVEDGITATDRAGVVASVKDANWTTLANFLRSGKLLPEGAGETEKTWGVVVYWEPGDNDNFWNLNNGKHLNEGDVLQIDLGVKLVATQEVYESDSFGDDYDTDAKAFVFPDFVGGSASTPIEVNNQGQTVSDVTMISGKIKVFVPAGVQVKSGVTELSMSVSEMVSSGANVSLGENEEILSLDVHIEGIADNNTVPITVTLAEVAPAGLNMGNYKLYHVESAGTKEMTLVDSSAEFTAHNQFKYDPATGDIALYMASFSEVAVVADTYAKWEGSVDHSWYIGKEAPYTIANADQLWSFSQIVGGMAKDENGNYIYTAIDSDGNEYHNDSFKGKTIKLIVDLNLADDEKNNDDGKIFYPIGYYNSEGTYERTNTAISSGLRNFEGTFDGNGHTIANFYHNTWEMKGDHNWYSPEEQYYRDGMGLFGRVYGGTVKNLTVSNFSSDGEIATTGCIAAYADGATFENIAIFNCNPRVYNIGNGGIVGCVGWYAKEEGLKTTFTNITVDNSNKISALWGSYDVACGGIVGQYYPTSGQTSAGTPKNAGIHMENCHVSAQMDVYNDVCANYQYYAYRYAGMMIGSIRENTTNDEGRTIPDMTGISASGCTVHFGTWNDYYYCELVDNTTASYTHDYQMSRLVEIKAIDGTSITYLDGTTGTVPASGRANYVIVDYTKGHGTNNATCYHFKDGAVWTHDMGGIQTGIDENGDGQDDLKEDKQHLYLEFNNLFTGYGWGVSSMAINKWNGITALDVTQGDHENAVEKFETVKFPNVVAGKEYTVGDFFNAKDDVEVEIDADNVHVFVSPEDSSKMVYVEYTPNTTDWTKGTLKFYGQGEAKIKITDYFYCKETPATVNVQGSGMLYRIGNAGYEGNASYDVTYKDIARVLTRNEEYTSIELNNTALQYKVENDKVHFDGTGIVGVKINGVQYYLEVVDAVNTVKATSATANNVVLLNNISSGFSVSGRYTFYGNGFALNYIGNGQYLNNGLKQGVVTVSENGTLDNLRIVASIYPNAYMYYGKTSQGDYVQEGPSTVDGDKTRYHYQLSAVAASGNATITNCYIYGGRNNIFVNTGDVTITDTVLECGTVANVQIQSNSSHTITFNNVTTIQYQVNPTIGDTSKVMLGAGVIVGPETNDNPSIVLNGDFKQYNWVTAGDADAVSDSTTRTIIETALGAKKFIHTVNGKTASNLGIVYMNAYDAPITNNTGLPYALATVSISSADGQVYSLQGATENQIYSDYVNADKDTTNGYYAPQFKYSADLGGQHIENTDGCDKYCYREGDTIYVMFPSGDSKELNLATLVNISKYSGQDLDLSITCKNENNNSVTVTGGKISLPEAGKYTVTYTVKDALFYNENGETLEKEVEYDWNVTLDVSLKDSAVPDAYFEFNSDSQKMGYYKPNWGDVKQYLPFLAGLKIYDYNGQTSYLRFDGDADFNKIASITITGYSSNKAVVEVKLTDGGVINTQFLARANSGGGSTYTGKIKTSNNTIYFVTDSGTSNKESTTTAAYWYVDYYKFTGNNGVAIQSAQQTFNSTGSSASTPSGNFGTTIKYTVTYDANGGNCGQTTGYATSASAAVTLPTPTRSGYIFTGWFTAASGGNPVGGAGESYTPSANITLYAQWGKPCTVTYNANGGSCGTASAKYTGTALTLPTATRDGYWFVGWYKEDGSKVGDAGATYTPSGEITLYAHWQEKVEYTVTYNANGGTCGTASATYQGTALTLPTPTKTGSKFLGWYTAASGGTKIEGTTYTPTANVTLYAQWEKIAYTITVSTNNATVSGVTNGQTAYYGDTITFTVTYSGDSDKTTTVKDADGNTVTTTGSYTFTMPASNVTITASSSCVTPDTLITLANGKQVRVDSLTGNEELLVWNMETGKLDSAPILFVDSEEEREYEIIHLYFSDGTDVKVISEHGFWDYDLNKYVYLDRYAEKYIGHTFARQNGSKLSKVTLTDVVLETEVTTAWSPVTAGHLCYFVNGMLSMPGGVGGLFNIFTVDPDTMTYDFEAMQRDIETYGLYTYEELNAICPLSEEMFNMAGGAYLKISIGKGNLTEEELIYMINRYSKFF